MCTFWNRNCSSAAEHALAAELQGRVELGAPSEDSYSFNSPVAGRVGTRVGSSFWLFVTADTIPQGFPWQVSLSLSQATKLFSCLFGAN